MLTFIQRDVQTRILLSFCLVYFNFSNVYISLERRREKKVFPADEKSLVANIFHENFTAFPFVRARHEKDSVNVTRPLAIV